MIISAFVIQGRNGRYMQPRTVLRLLHPEVLRYVYITLILHQNLNGWHFGCSIFVTLLRKSFFLRLVTFATKVTPVIYEILQLGFLRFRQCDFTWNRGILRRLFGMEIELVYRVCFVVTFFATTGKFQWWQLNHIITPECRLCAFYHARRWEIHLFLCFCLSLHVIAVFQILLIDPLH